jgi:hypothetical protein
MATEDKNVEVAEFSFQQLTLKDQEWTVKIALAMRLPEVHQYYNIRFFLNQEPFKKNTLEMEKRLKKVEEDQTLFPKENKERIRDAKEDVNAAKDAHRDAVAKYEDIKFQAIVQKSEYKQGRTILTMYVRAETVSQIDAHKYDLMPFSGQDNVYHTELTKLDKLKD